MVAKMLTLDGLKDSVGVELGPVVRQIDKGLILRFVQAIDDPNPLWQDEEHASKSSYGGLVAPPTLALVLAFDRIQQLLTSNPSLTVLHGSSELESFKPLRVGDVITVSMKIANVRERKGKAGRTAFVTFEMTCRNQKKEEVARCRQLAIVS